MNGLKIQWGKITSNTSWTSKDIGISLTYSNTSYTVYVQAEYVNTPATYPIGVKITDAQHFNVKIGGSSLYSVNYITIGY